MYKQILGLLAGLSFAAASSAQTNVVYDIHKSYAASSGFYYPGDDGKPVRVVVGQGFLVPHKEAPNLKRGSYKDICWGALPAGWVVNSSDGIFIVPSGEPLSKCWKFAPKGVQTALSSQ